MQIFQFQEKAIENASLKIVTTTDLEIDHRTKLREENY